MSRVSKEKQAKTLEKMQKVRYEDTLFLREIIASKLKWANEEKQKGLNNIKILEAQINVLKKSVLRLEGCILVLQEVSTIPKDVIEQKKGKK